MSRKNIIGFFAWLTLVIIAAVLGGIANANAGNFYSQLDQPTWAPPGWLFGPVWGVLYLMMSVAAWLVWKTHGFRGARVALGLFLFQLALNSLWTWLFFAASGRCWGTMGTAVGVKVVDLAAFAPSHSGGSAHVTSSCGLNIAAILSGSSNSGDGFRHAHPGSDTTTLTSSYSVGYYDPSKP